MARQYRQQLEAGGRAYGDPLAALEVLEAQCDDAEAAVRVLESRRKGLRAVQEKAEVNSDIPYVRKQAAHGAATVWDGPARLFLCYASQAGWTCCIKYE